MVQKIESEERKARKRAYIKEWYKANKLYKGTYLRIYKKAKKSATKAGATMYEDAAKVIVEDRKERVKRGRWIDERTGEIYNGITLE